MKYLLLCTTVLFLLLPACKHAVPTHSEATQEAFTYPVYETDSVQIRVRNADFHFSILLDIGAQHRVFDLDSLGIPSKTPDAVEWTSAAYASIMVWWSQAQSRHVFVPLRRELPLVYVDRQVAASDSVTGQVVFLEQIQQEEHRAMFTVENLVSRRKMTVSVPLDPQAELFPPYDSVSLKGDVLRIWAAAGMQQADVSEIRN